MSKLIKSFFSLLFLISFTASVSLQIELENDNEL